MAPRPTAPPGTEADPITFSITIQAVLKTVLPVPRLNLNAVNSEEQPPTETEVEDNSGVAPLPEPIYKAPVFRFKFIDGSDFFSEIKDPLSIFHYNLPTHFNEKGYDLLAEHLKMNIINK